MSYFKVRELAAKKISKQISLSCILKLGQPRFRLSSLVGVWLLAASQIIAAQTVRPLSSQLTTPPPQTNTTQQTQSPVKLTSTSFVGQTGLTIEQLTKSAFAGRADLLAARQRLSIAEGRVRQAGLSPNPTLDAEYGSPRILGGDPETDLTIGVSQTFELGGKRRRRVAVAKLELAQAKAEVTALERQTAAEVRQAYVRAMGAARQLDALENLLAADQETVRVTEARFKEGDVAPLDVNLVRVENDRLRVQQIEARNELETAVLQLQTLAGLNVAESLQIAPQPERPPRLDMNLGELTEIALRERADLQAARLGEELGTARINLAKSGAMPNVTASVRYNRNKQIVDLPETAGGGVGTDLDNELTFGVSIDIPVFNRNQGEIAVSTNEQIQATRQREFLEASIRRDVAVAYRSYRAAAEKLVLYSTQILPRSQENLRSTRAAYGFGEFSVFEVVNEQRRLSESVTGYNQSLRDYYTALAQLEIALGMAIPPTAFAPTITSVLPEKSIVPHQAERERFLQDVFAKPTTEDSDFTKPKLLQKKEDNK